MQATKPAWQRFVLGRAGDVLMCVWAVAEGTLWFIVPDVLITLSAGLSPKRGLRHVALTIVGSLIAGAIMYIWAVRDPSAARGVVASVPFVTEPMFTRVAADYASSGWIAPLLGPTSGIPYKVYAVLAPEHLSLVVFLSISILARAERLLITWAQFAVIGWGLRRWTARPARWLVCVHALYWVVIYGIYWSGK